MHTQPDYNKIYHDLILMKFPEKADELIPIINSKIFTFLDVIKFNNQLFGNPTKENLRDNQKHRSYDTDTIFQFLEYQRKHGLNNIELGKRFNLSRNSIAKWKKFYFSGNVKNKSPQVE